jgi:hypothetical protein
MDAAQIGFEETFALAEDRAEALKELIPGTEDYYFYSCLYFEQKGDLQKVDEILKQWIKRYSYSAQAQEIQNRLMLLNYQQHPDKTVEHIRQKLGLAFNHQKRQQKQKTSLPHQLSQNLISFANFSEMAFRDYKDLSGFELRALPLLLDDNINADRRRHLLQQLQRPEGKNLVQLIIADLRHQYSGGFGSMPIHSRLTLAQLDECLKLMPELINQTNFILAYLKKLRPSDDENLINDPEAMRRCVHEMWLFARKLSPAFNSLKAHLTYHLLDFDRKVGRYNRTLFNEYLKLPRRTTYMNSKYYNDRDNARYLADLGANFQPHTMMRAINNDEELIRDYFSRIFQDEQSPEEYYEYIDSNYLNRLFAETKILYGIGDMEKWYSMLDPQSVNQLKEKIELEFLPDCQTTFKPDETVEVSARVKAIKKLIVKVYQINPINFYRENLSEINTDIDLDGLVANYEQTINYDHPEHRRHHERFSFKELPARGVFVIELIGNGISSRALVRKGGLSFMARTTSAGQLLTIFNESAQQVKDAKIWMDGREYESDKDGLLLIPFSTNQGSKTMIIRQGDFAALQKFDHQGENYQLHCGFYVDREALIEGKKASVTFRPQLRINDVAADIGLLKEATLVISTTDAENVAAVKEVPGIELFNDKESIFEFTVPEKLVNLTFTLKGKVENLSNNRKDELSSNQSFNVNAIAATEKTEAIFTRLAGGVYQAMVLGLSGEPVADRPIRLEIKNRYFTRSIHTSLQTDKNGLVELGELKDIEWVKLAANECADTILRPVQPAYSWTDLINANAGDKIQIPYFADQDNKIDDIACLFEMRNGSYYRDLTEKMRLTPGLIEVDNLEAGDYEIFVKEPQQAISLKITKGKKIAGYAVSENRILETTGGKPLQITEAVSMADGRIKIKLANVSKSTRAQVIATNFVPDFSLFAELCGMQNNEGEMLRLLAPESKYLSGRNIGDEYKYILERKYAKIFAGNMLKRPGLLLNPWSLRKTDTSRKDAAGGDAWKKSREREIPAHLKKKGRPGKAQAFAGNSSFIDLDFLPTGSVQATNLRPDKDGCIYLDRKEFHNAQHFHILATDDNDSVYTSFSIAAATIEPVDLAMRRGLDPEKNFSEQKNISVVNDKQKFGIDDITTAKIEVYDSIATVYRLFSALNPDAKLAEFSFITGWNKLDEAKKLELYSKFACHELSFFIYKKDQPFFEKVIKPYLVNKHDKTFMDHWLIDENLEQYLEPWAYHRLNIVEKILLASKIDKEQARTHRHVEDLFDLLPKDIEHFNHLFKTAVKGSALETDDRLGFGAGLEEAMADLPAEPMPAPQAIARAIMPSVSAPRAPRARSAKMMMKEESFVNEDLVMESADEEYDGASLEIAAGRRDEVRQFFRQLDKTEEWVENNYYKLPIEQQVAGLITVNEFWKDYAARDARKPFVSKNLALASRNFTEMMLALAVLDLPFTSEKHETSFDKAKMSLAAASNLVVFHREIKPVKEIAKTQSILVGQNFFAHNDRYFYEKNERFDKFVTEEFLTRRVYGCQIVMTNPTSSRKNVDVLLQIPNGALPVLNGFYTRSLNFQLDPFTTKTHEYYFYFPAPGTFAHYPVHVSEEETMIAAGKPFIFKVVDELTSFDKTSWPYIAEYGSDDEVLDYLEHNNIDRLDLSLMAFRLKNRDFFSTAYELLKKRRVYHDLTWSYSLYHQRIEALKEYLAHSALANQCGSTFSSQILEVEPVSRHAYQHREYWPLVNARVYPLGKKREILNQQFADQYKALLNDLRYHARLDDHDLMALTYYLLLQDRIEEALQTFAKVDAKRLSSKLQYDYMQAYLAFYEEKPDQATAIAQNYKDYPVLRWRNLFNDILAQAAEISGKAATVVDSEDRNQKTSVLADTQPDFDFSIENRKIKLNHRNLDRLDISYYQMDIELLFSKKPFVGEVSDQFSFIRPNEKHTISLAGQKAEMELDLPSKFCDSNMMVEITGSGISRSRTYFPHSLTVNLAEQYGQVRISSQKTGKPLAKVYIKVYSRMKDGGVIFYKDGYTDLRGKFDYASLSTDQLDQVEKFAILIMSEDQGSLIREAAPPTR